MATHQIPILGFSTLPDTSGNVFFEPYTIKATNDFWGHGHFIFNDTATDDDLYGTFTVPQNYVGSPLFQLIWTSTATTGNVVWQLIYRTVGEDDTTSLDQTTAEESLTAVTDAAPGTTNFRLSVSLGSATAGNFAAGETVEWRLSRNGTSGSDTMAAAAQMVGLLFQYADA